MSDTEDHIFRHLRDLRILALDKALMIQTELRDSRTLAAILEAISTDSESAMHEFAEINPADTSAVTALQARVFRLIYFKQTIAAIYQDGEQAEAGLNQEDVSDL